ncbi:glycerate kinase [Clostridiaceae bacterium HSG29]|nr:glycerate kinase [Clostridiaceae bacterium HSG29]
MRILIAVDSFKDSLNSINVSKSIKAGILKANKEIDVKEIPLADGGEGTMQILINNLDGKIIETYATNPLGKRIKVSYGIFNNIAIIEMASVAGLQLLKEYERNPLKTSTFGVGELILDALEKGIRKFIIAIGGSSTNDGGVGMAAALGAKFLDKDLKEIELNGKGLEDLYEIDISNIDNRINDCDFKVACDVNNVLCGANGAAYIYAKQKGANDVMVEILDKNLLNYSKILKKDLGIDILNIEGAGAAGGLGAGLIAFLNGKLESGFEIVSEILKLEDEIKKCDLVITGEGKFDLQSLNGKAPIGVGKLARKYNKKVVVIAGSIGELSDEIFTNGISSVFSIIDKPMDLSDALKKEVTEKGLRKLSEQIIRLLMN